MKKLLLKSLILLGCICPLFFWNTFAQSPNPGYTIMPEVKNPESLSNVIQEVGAVGGEVMETYKQKSTELSLEQQMATGIMNRDTILEYIVYLVRFVSQIWLFVGAAMIIYAGYKYASNIFWWKTGEGSTAIKRAIIGVLVISFAYAIMRIFTVAFLGT